MSLLNILRSRINTDSSGRPFKVLLAVCIVLGLVIFTLAMCGVGLAERKTTSSQTLCTTRACIHAAADAVAYMNRSARPCDDFYAYACGRFAHEHPFPANPYFEELTETIRLQEHNDRKLMDLLNPLDPDGKGQPKTARGKMNAFYKQCLETYQDSAYSNVAYFMAKQAQEFHWQALDGYYPYDFNNYDLQKFSLQHAYDGILFDVRVEEDHDKAENKSTPSGDTALDYVIEIWPARTFFNDFFLPGDIDPELYKLYHNYQLKTLIMFAEVQYNGTYSIPDWIMENMISSVKDTIQYEQMLATYIEQSDAKPVYITIDELQRKYSGGGGYYSISVDWYDLLRDFLYGGAQLSGSDKVKMYHVGYFDKLINSLSYDATRVNNYMMWKLSEQYKSTFGPYFVAELVAFYEDYYHYLDKFNETTAAFRSNMDTYCLDEVKQHFEVALGHLFIRKHFGESRSKQIEALVNYIYNAHQDRVGKYSWMSDNAKALALKKLNYLSVRLGYPEWMWSEDEVNKYYENLPYDSTKSWTQNVQNSYNHRRAVETGKLIQSRVKKDDWFSHGDVIHSYADYKQERNELYVPAGQLQLPFFSAFTQQFFNFGAIGRTVAAKLVEAIDITEGQFYDYQGFTVAGGWYDKSTNAAAAKMKTCYLDLIDKSANISVDDRNALARDVWLDTGALKSAFQGYMSFKSHHNDETRLPGLHKETNEQSFFISYAQMHCASWSHNVTLQRILDHRDAPERTLLNLVLSQSDDFVSAFNCPADSRYRQQEHCVGF